MIVKAERPDGLAVIPLDKVESSGARPPARADIAREPRRGSFADHVAFLLLVLAAGIAPAASMPIIVGEDRVPVVSSCVLIYTGAKAFRCDRLFANGFDR